MRYRVEFSPRAEQDVDDYITHIADESKDLDVAARVLRRIMRATNGLNTFPRRCAKAPEDELTDYEVRMLIVGSLLLLYNVNDDTRLVKIVAAPHGRQLPLTDL